MCNPTENNSHGLDITPETRVGALLKNYPDLENVLIDLSPAFAKLRNPVLRKTVARVANLRQVAQIGNVSLGDVINTLRQAAGMEAYTVEGDQGSRPDDEPDWMKETVTGRSFDARPLIESGGHPLNAVLEDLDSLGEKERYELITPFLPAPLIEIVENRGYRSFSKQESDDLVKTYFVRSTT